MNIFILVKKFYRGRRIGDAGLGTRLGGTGGDAGTYWVLQFCSEPHMGSRTSRVASEWSGD
jgi:hypothetical protein